MPSHSSPRPPRAAAEIFGEQLALAVRYADLLVSTGIEHGLLGPREAPKVWERHIVNCAAVESLLPHRTRLIDIGSGAGLPGLALAIARPDLKVTLIEPLARRTRWLDDAVAQLGLTQVSVQRARAEDMGSLIQAPVVTARAVARLDKLATWAWPLLPEGGRLLALKGQSADDELMEAGPTLDRLGTGRRVVHDVGADVLDPPVRVIELVKSTVRAPRGGSPTSQREKLQ
ncbi:MAG: 16S rRNA (guanine(527)-N(7))-methyltransferase RsmG [Ornithinimicrobium sp.]